MSKDVEKRLKSAQFWLAYDMTGAVVGATGMIVYAMSMWMWAFTATLTFFLYKSITDAVEIWALMEERHDAREQREWWE
jgi:hypothetical protein